MSNMKFHTQGKGEQMAHPTPAEIMCAIFRKLNEDAVKYPVGGQVPFIPVRTLNIVEQAIAELCEKKAGRA
jgi:hypothetical protein